MNSVELLDLDPLLDEITELISRKKLVAPALFLLESHIPLREITHTLLIISGPVLRHFIGARISSLLSTLFHHEDGLFRLRERLLALDATL